MSAIAAYQNRLRALVDEAKGSDGLRELARRMGDENLRTSLSYWLKEELSRPLLPASYEALARVDKMGRNASEIEYWLRTGEQLPKLECVSQPVLMRALLAS
jgi:hypothetical protein